MLENGSRNHNLGISGKNNFDSLILASTQSRRTQKYKKNSKNLKGEKRKLITNPKVHIP